MLHTNLVLKRAHQNLNFYIMIFIDNKLVALCSFFVICYLPLISDAIVLAKRGASVKVLRRWVLCLFILGSSMFLSEGFNLSGWFVLISGFLYLVVMGLYFVWRRKVLENDTGGSGSGSK